MIKVKIKCFSQVKYALEVDDLSLELPSGSTSSKLEEIIREMSKGKLDNISLRLAINQNYVNSEIELKDGDEVVFIPPVQGG
mgnify:FL=1|jgi:molybdopterin converting factor small subunit|tara:strand:+ start:19633 stop:19878 length:246 start_codon:yes stop_codon:yes gene_type:complete